MTIHFHVHSISFSEIPNYGVDHILSRLDRNEISDDYPIFSPNHSDGPSSSNYLNREKLAAILDRYHRSIGKPLQPKTLASIRTDALFLMTGQQPGLMTGPIYSFLKAVTIIKAAKIYSEQLNVPILPAFWVATEDHDLPEVNRFTINHRKFVADDHFSEVAGKPVGEIGLENSKEEILEFIRKTLPSNEYLSDIETMIQTVSFKNYSRQFIDLLYALFPDHNLIIIDPLSITDLTSFVLADMAGMWPAIENAFSRGTQELKKNGFPAQLDAVAFFEIINSKRIRWKASRTGFKVHDGILSFSDARQAIKEEHRRFSPGAALRPVIQDAVLPVIAYVGGPAEMMYLWQIDPLYSLLDVKRSKIMPRISATFIERKIKKAATRMDLFPNGVFHAANHLKNYQPDSEIMKNFDSIITLNHALEHEIKAHETNQNRKWLNKSLDSIRYNIKKIQTKLAEEKLRTHGLGRQSLEKIAADIVPGGKLQERTENILRFVGYYGPDFVTACMNDLTLATFHHQLVEINDLKQ